MTPSPAFVRFFVLFALASGLVAAKRLAVDSYAADELYQKDFVQEWVLARAMVDREYPYAPAPDMIARYFPETKPNVPWHHPTPHTPPAALLSVPIGFFAYEVAVTIWLAVELCLLVALVVLLAKWWGEPVSLGVLATLVFASLALGPVIQDLWYGQFSFILAVLLTLSWLNLRCGRDAVGGALLGAAVAMKLTAWPVGLFLLLTRRWRAVVAAGVVVALLQLAAAAVMGPQAVVDYYRDVGPRIADIYRQHKENFSLWTVGARFFAPEMQKILSNFLSRPLIESPPLDRAFTIGLPLIALAAAMILALRARQFDTAFGVLVCASLPLNPVVWDHYLLLAAAPVAVVLRRLKDRGFPRGMTTAFAVCALIAVFPYKGYLAAVVWAFGTETPGNVETVPFFPGLITYILLVPLVGWIALLVRTDTVGRET